MSILGIMASCSDNDSPAKLEVYQRPALDVKNAQSLAAISSNTGGRVAGATADQQTQLYKLTADGSLAPVTFINADGTNADTTLEQTISVSSIVKVNNDYIEMNGNFAVWDTTGVNQFYSSLLVRKTDGAIFDFNESLAMPDFYRPGDDIFPQDAAGNIYFLTRNRSVSRLDLKAPDNLTQTDYLPGGQVVYNFSIDKNGNCAYNYNNLAQGSIRMRKVNGGLEDIMVEGRTNAGYWTGANGTIYFVTYATGNSSIHTLEVVDNKVITTQVWITDDVNTYTMFLDTRESNNAPYRIKKKNSIVFVGSNTEGARSWEFSEIDNTVTLLDLPSFSESRIIVQSDKYYYIAHKTDLYKIDLETHQYTKLFSTGQYQVYAMSVSKDDVLQFSGLRFSDGKKVFAQVNATNALSILNETAGMQATVLQRLN